MLFRSAHVSTWANVDSAQTTTWSDVTQDFDIVEEGPQLGGETLGGISLSTVKRITIPKPSTVWEDVVDNQTITWSDVVQETSTFEEGPMFGGAAIAASAYSEIRRVTNTNKDTWTNVDTDHMTYCELINKAA